MTGVCAQSDAAIKDEYACSTLPVRGPCKGPEQGGCLLCCDTYCWQELLTHSESPPRWLAASTSQRSRPSRLRRRSLCVPVEELDLDAQHLVEAPATLIDVEAPATL